MARFMRLGESERDELLESVLIILGDTQAKVEIPVRSKDDMEWFDHKIVVHGHGDKTHRVTYQLQFYSLS